MRLGAFFRALPSPQSDAQSPGLDMVPQFQKLSDHMEHTLKKESQT